MWRKHTHHPRSALKTGSTFASRQAQLTPRPGPEGRKPPSSRCRGRIVRRHEPLGTTSRDRSELYGSPTAAHSADGGCRSHTEQWPLSLQRRRHQRCRHTL
ncbi:hypothetical protein MRX96_036155 [Rhipicephalus microplus]